MMMSPSKKLSTIIASKYDPSEGSDSITGSKDPMNQADNSSGKEDAMHDLMEAVHAKDAKKAAMALSNFLDMHEEEEGEPVDTQDEYNV